MKKILGILGILLLISSQVFAAYQWRHGSGENSILGTETGADIDAVSYQDIVSPLDRVLSNHRQGCKIKYLSASTLTVEAGEVVVSNSAGSIRLMQQNTSDTTVTWSDIDTDSEKASTTYYVYAYQNTVTTSTFSIKLSTSSTAPTGVTYYKRLGSFYNNSSSNIERIVNDDGGQQVYQAVGSTSNPTTTSTGYTDLTDMSVSITTDDNPILVLFSGVFSNNTAGQTVGASISIDGTNYGKVTMTADTADYRKTLATSYLKNVTAGSHTVKIQWAVGGGTGKAYSTWRRMQVIELR